MRLSLSVVISALAAATSALSTTGSRLLVVLDDVADKAAYGQFFGDLAGEFASITGLPTRRNARID